MRWLVLAMILAGCDDLDGPVTDLAAPDLSGPVPCLAPPNGFCVWGVLHDFVTLKPVAGQVALISGDVILAESEGPFYSMTVDHVEPSAVLVSKLASLELQPAAFDAFHIDMFDVPPVFGGRTMMLFFSDFSPSPIKQTLALFHPVDGVTVSLPSADGGAGAVQYVGADRATIDATATATTSAGAALIDSEVGTAEATGGSCTGPCAWPSAPLPRIGVGVVTLVPRYQ